MQTNLILDHVTCIHGRAEDGRDPDYREKFQWVTARAVAPLPVLLEYCAPFIEVGGYFVAMKGSNVESEMEEAANAIKLLNLSIVDQREFELPFDMGGRSIIISKKNPLFRKNIREKPVFPAKSRCNSRFNLVLQRFFSYCFSGKIHFPEGTAVLLTNRYSILSNT